MVKTGLSEKNTCFLSLLVNLNENVVKVIFVPSSFV